jgi:hypothetical protein
MSVTDQDLLSLIKTLNPEFAGINEQPIIDISQVTLGWHSTVLTKSKVAVGGGTHKDRPTARRIAIAEFIERSLFLKLLTDQTEVKRFGLNLIPTTSGFAAGFDANSTRFRSLCEGLERWAWSMWIDKHFKFDSVQPVFENPLVVKLLEPFISYKAYRKVLMVRGPGFEQRLVIGILLGFTEQGVFAGSRVTSEIDDLWTHAAIEVWRNHNNFEVSYSQNKAVENLGWLERRVTYFGKNRDEAMRQINLATKGDLPVAEIHLNLGIEPYKGIHLWRTLCKDFVPWHMGSDSRFVY